MNCFKLDKLLDIILFLGIENDGWKQFEGKKLF